MKGTSLDDIIAAISTPLGHGGISIVRLSGSGCVALANEVFRGGDLTKKESHTIHFGHIVDPKTNKDIDEVLVSIMLAPRTYTREDVVEINCHGGYQAAGKTLEVLLSQGARLAERGEFTKRAFLNGRIDLSQAEAVIDLIEAKTDLGRQSAINQLEGGLKKKVYDIRDRLLSVMASIEVSIDYPEHDVEEETYESLKEKIGGLLEETNSLLSSANQGKIIRDGISTVILGKPNVGKSSLLNFLLEEERAIVTDIAGTTRDTVEEMINIGGVPVRLADTAGIRSTEDLVEKIGVEKSKQYAKNADLVLLVIDTSTPLSAEDREILSWVDREKVLVLLNKIDLGTDFDTTELDQMFPKENQISISAKKGTGIDALSERLKEMFLGGEVESSEEVRINQVRHQTALQQAKESMEKALHTVEIRMPVDFVSMDLMEAYEHYGEITGDSVDEALIDRIFSEFCLGK